LYPGKHWWTFAYVLLGLGSLIIGFLIRKSNKKSQRWLKRFGLYITPAVLVLRGISNLFANGVDGAVGTTFLFWAAFVVIWAAYLLKYIATESDEWDELEKDFINLKNKVNELNHD
jgi:hypothetical protein